MDGEVTINLPNMGRQSTASTNTQTRRVWHSCCLQCDKDALVFICSYFLLGGLLIFFAMGLWTSDSCETSNLYQSLMLLVLGVILPSPRMK